MRKTNISNTTLLETIYISYLDIRNSIEYYVYKTYNYLDSKLLLTPSIYNKATYYSFLTIMVIWHILPTILLLRLVLYIISVLFSAIYCDEYILYMENFFNPGNSQGGPSNQGGPSEPSGPNFNNNTLWESDSQTKKRKDENEEYYTDWWERVADPAKKEPNKITLVPGVDPFLYDTSKGTKVKSIHDPTGVKMVDSFPSRDHYGNTPPASTVKPHSILDIHNKALARVWQIPAATVPAPAPVPVPVPKVRRRR
jgi:hypothetical protein